MASMVSLYVCISLHFYASCQAVYSASFSEDIPTNKGILTVGATDADSGSSAEVQYSLFGIGVEDHQKDRAQLGIEAINRREQMVYSRGQTPKHMQQTGHHESWKQVLVCVCLCVYVESLLL